MELIRRPDTSNYETYIIPPDVFGDLGRMDCEPVKLRLKRGAVPHSVHAVRRVPMPMRTALKPSYLEWRRMKSSLAFTVRQSGLLPLSGDEKNGDVRICVDLNRLNGTLLPEKFEMLMMDELLPKF